MENLNQGYKFAKLSALKEFADMVYTTVDGKWQECSNDNVGGNL